MVGSSRSRGIACCTSIVGLAVASIGLAAGAPAAASASEPRAYELVSPADKSGGDVMAYSTRTRAAADGNAVQFASLTGFADVRGTGVAVEYIAHRTPGGWVTHAITPTVEAASVKQLAGTGDAFYDWEFTPGLEEGVFSSVRSVTDDPSTRDAGNLYLRDDLLSPGAGSYRLLTGCPLCDETRTPLAPPGAAPAAVQLIQPVVAGASPDMGHVAFESIRNLTDDAPAQPPLCGPGFPPDPLPWVIFCNPRLYEWDHGQVRLVGILPDGTPADASQAATGARGLSLTLAPHTVSDGSDGHSRIFFTFPTDDGSTTDAAARTGNVYMRVDHAQTIQLNVPESAPASPYAPAQFLDASRNGERIFFMTQQALTSDAPTDGSTSLYMYDASKPNAAPDNLTLVTRPQQPGAGSVSAQGMIGASDDGRYVYMVAAGPVLAGQSIFDTGIYVWHDGEVRRVAPMPTGPALNELFTDGVGYGQTLRQARVTPDGRHLLFTSNFDPSGNAFDNCSDFVGSDCRAVYVYSADTGRTACISCKPDGSLPASSATVPADAIHGGARVTSHQSRGIADDGSRAFFSTADALVPEDTNGKIDAYEWRADGIDGCAGADGCVSLISTGKDPADSWFAEASADGRDAFFVTRQRLVGWDVDSAYDLYDARIGGGFPEPPPPAPPCSGGTCQGPLAAAPAASAPGSATFHGAGNARGSLRARARRAARGCRRGYVKRRVGHRVRCVRRVARRHHAHRGRS